MKGWSSALRESGWRVGARAAALVAGGLVWSACTGETLFDGGGLTGGPRVEIVSPTGGDEATAGRPVPLIVVAADSLGVAEISVAFRGATTGVLEFKFSPARDTAVVDTVISLPAGVSGALELRATATNVFGGVGQSSLVVVPVTARDSITPGLTVTAQVPARMELTDSIRATITAVDNPGGTGLVRMGLTVLVTSTRASGTQVFERVIDLGAPRMGVVTREIVFAPPFATAAALPNTLSMTFHAFAVDSAGNCAAAVSAQPQRLTCGTLQNATVAAGVTPPPVPTTVVMGRSILFPSGATIRDAVPDVTRERLYLSNFGQSQLEVLNLRTLAFTPPVRVGSQPWGLHLNINSDTLIVANSGGTSLSYVTLTGTPAEVLSQRVQTPNVNLFEVKFSRDATGVQRYDVVFLDFSDRPQYVAQDVQGRLLYSTLPTGAAPDGTMRMADKRPGWAQPEVRLLLGRNVTVPDSFTISIINVDSVRVFTSTSGDGIEIYDHRRGFPGTIVRSGLRTLQGALDSLDVDPDSDIIWIAGRFDRTLVGLGPETFVAASGNRERVAFGEGGRVNGRIFMWESVRSDISNEITVADLVGNTAEQIAGLDLNQDGTLNTARGIGAAFYFKEDLRLQGHFAAASAAGSGAALHPNHPSYTSLPPSGPNTLGFVAAGRAVKIVDTVHFIERGDLQIRDNIIGPLKVSLPLPGDNAGCTGADCIVARLYGVTDAGAVVLVEVRGRDIR